MPRLTPQQILSADSTIYIDNFEFYNILSSNGKYYFPNGFVSLLDGSHLKYNFMATDHLGNTRAVTSIDYNGVHRIEQKNSYYAYGGIMDDVAESADVQTHKYNGKELDRMHGLDWYDYHARQYDGIVNQFWSMDPLCEKYYNISPYVYCAGNPVKYVDPDGRDIWELSQNGRIQWKEKSESHQLIALDSNGNRTDNSIIISDRKILDNLSNDRESTNSNYAITKSEEAAKVFLFASSNSKVEWEIARFNNGNNIVGTSHESSSVNLLDAAKLDEKTMLLDIHSHWEKDGTKGGSGVDSQGNYWSGGDMYNISIKSEKFAKLGLQLPRYYVFHVATKGLYEFKPTNPSIFKGFIKSYNSLSKTFGGK